MKKLSKIKLINWHSFCSDTIEIKDNCLITGENGSGKSTLLDAIQYVLTAGKAKFNQAADDTSKRTIETYIRGKVGYDGKEYLRDDVTAYIVLEFFDEEKNQSDLLGAVIEYSLSQPKPYKLFFKMDNQEIKDSVFIMSDNTAKPIHQFKLTTNVDSTENSKRFQEIICAFLGIGGKDKYFELLPKSLAFKPIKDINEFVNSFLLTEKSISLETLQQNVENFSRLEREIALEEEKIQKLEEIEEKHQNYLNTKSNIARNDYFLNSIECEKLTNDINNTRNKIEKRQNDINLKTGKLVTKEKEVENLKGMINTYELKLKENQEYQLYDEWDAKVKELKLNQKKLKQVFDNFNQDFNNEKDTLKIFAWHHQLKAPLNTPSDVDSFEKILSDCIEKKNEEKEKYDTRVNSLNYFKNEKGKEKKALEEKISLMQKKKFPYKDAVNQLILVIKDYFKTNLGEDIEVRPLCEYLEITNEKWRNAIEGYLNNQRFDLIIEPRYFDEALKIYEKYKIEKKIYGVGLVNTQKLEDSEVNQNSLAKHITSKNIYAKRYALFLLNKVTCCEDVGELKRHNNAITPSCMTYRNNVARQINPKVYEDYFIGQEGIKLQLAKTEEQLLQLNKEYDELLKQHVEASKYLKILKESKLDRLQLSISKVREYLEIEIEIEKFEKNKKNLEVTGLLSNALSEKERLNKDCELLKDEINQINKEIAEDKIKITFDKDDINQKEARLKDIKNTDINEDWEKEYCELRKNQNILALEGQLKKDLDNNKDNLAKYENTIELYQKNYNDLYQFDQVVGIENTSSYLNELYNKREIDLKNRKAQSAEFKEACQISFREDFISKIRDKIESAERDLKELNKSLKDKKFGSERYEFVFDKSKDPEMANYYRIIMSGGNYQMNNLFEEQLQVEDRHALDDLFKKISASNNEVVSQKIIDEYTDYRNYMSYDIKVTKDSGESYNFSRLAREKSGGEIQTPFYVIIAACFEQLLHSSRRNTSTGCVVMFDEAFNNMDESRIEAMMNFYKELNVQLLIAVPPEKTYIIDPYVETTLVMMNNPSGTYVKSIRLGAEDYD